jgi:RNA methyltransferase, TrmH family
LVVASRELDDGTIRLDGFHALKHAVRFGAKIVSAHTERFDATLVLAAELAPELIPWLREHLEPVEPGTIAALSNEVHPTRVVAFAKRPTNSLSALAHVASPAVLLEDPRHLGNVGASIRVAAALGASGLITTGDIDPWRSDAIRGSAGLHFALPIVGPIQVGDLGELSNPLVALDPYGVDIADAEIAANSILCFGTERDGITDELLSRCSRRVRLPMRRGVSSMNLATSVSATLFYLSSGPLRSSFDLERADLNL